VTITVTEKFQVPPPKVSPGEQVSTHHSWMKLCWQAGQPTVKGATFWTCGPEQIQGWTQKHLKREQQGFNLVFGVQGLGRHS
jgi:hypothetical protein